MAEDPIYQKEALEIAEEFGAADWEAFEIAEREARFFEARELRPPTAPLRITPASRGGGKHDVSLHHDLYLVGPLDGEAAIEPSDPE
jgi:hypothetical protein